MNALSYAELIRRKMDVAESSGMTVDPASLSPHLFGYQRDLVKWALARGRAAVFADTGLGKTLMQCEWARVVSEHHGRVLVLTPLAVAQQTVREAAKFGIAATYMRDDDGVTPIVVTNYEMLDRFEPSRFAGVVLDESSILKAYDGRTRTAIIEAFSATAYRLACTATPAPNDHTELGNHAEFLGVKSRVEMLAEYFAHDGGSTSDWRLKGHAVGDFWRWVCSWAAIVRKPSDMGYPDHGFDLEPLSLESLPIEVPHEDAWARGNLFAVAATTISDQRDARRSTTDQRVAAIAAAVAAEPEESAVIWCELNAESSALTAAIPGSVEVKGSDTPEEKAERLTGFADGVFRVLVTKPSIAGFGLNWQHCARVYFVGPSHSYEQTYQAIRRCWRFGQTRPVIVRTCVADTERAVLANYNRKSADADALSARMLEYVSHASYQSGDGARRVWNDYHPSATMEIPRWMRTA